MAWFFIPLIFAGAVALFTLTVISLKVLIKHIKKKKTGVKNEKVEFIRQKINDGDYNTVKCNLYTGGFIFKDYSSKAKFEGKKIDNDLKRLMGNKKKIVMKVRDL
jgi:hypothetical protein